MALLNTWEIPHKKGACVDDDYKNGVIERLANLRL
jgi:hypothetical protein